MESTFSIFIRGNWPSDSIFFHRKNSANLKSCEVMAPTKQIEDGEIDFSVEESLTLNAT